MDKDYFCNKLPKHNEVGIEKKNKESVVVRRSERERKITKSYGYDNELVSCYVFYILLYYLL